MCYEGYKYYRICEGKKVKCLGDAGFHKAVRKGRDTSFCEAVNVTCTEHNHPPVQGWCSP